MHYWLRCNGALEKKTLPSHRYKKMTIVEVYCHLMEPNFGNAIPWERNLENFFNNLSVMGV